MLIANYSLNYLSSSKNLKNLKIKWSSKTFKIKFLITTLGIVKKRSEYVWWITLYTYIILYCHHQQDFIQYIRDIIRVTLRWNLIMIVINNILRKHITNLQIVLPVWRTDWCWRLPKYSQAWPTRNCICCSIGLMDFETPATSRTLWKKKNNYESLSIVINISINKLCLYARIYSHANRRELFAESQTNIKDDRRKKEK